MKIGDVVKPLKSQALVGDRPGFGIILDTYEDDYGIIYYEVHWISGDPEWWKENELELISESD